MARSNPLLLPLGQSAPGVSASATVQLWISPDIRT